MDEHPVLLDTAERYVGEVQLVGILYDDEPAAAREFLVRYGDGGYPTGDDPTGSVALAYGVLGPPETFFNDAEGVIRAKHYGPLTEADMADNLALIGVSP